MRVLSLEESKQITIKFLKHFGCYDKEKLDKYFIPPPPRPKMSIFRWVYKFLTASLPSRMTIYDFFPPNIDVFKKHYEESLVGSLITFEDETKYDKLYKAFEKTVKENNLLLFYAMSIEGRNQKIISFNKILEGIEEIWPRLGISIFIFPYNFSFLLELIDDDAIVIYGTKKFIADFKKNYPDYRIDLNL